MAEYKQVTVLFADVVHSMDLAAAVGPERLRELMSDMFDCCCEVVQRYGGTVDKFTGDGLMAVFGAPVSLEDHAIRACMAALDIQQRVRELDLQLRVGLNSGEVIAGEIGSRATSYTTIGDQVGMAQRMESVAPAGGVMLSESTARLIEGEAELRDRQFVSIKGAATPVPAYQLLATTGRRRDATAHTSFVGREWELTALTAMLNQAMKGRGCVAGVVGPPGIGKSRIVAEVVSRAEHAGVQVFSTYCESHTSDVAFQAATRLLRSAWRVHGLDEEAARQVVRSRVPGANPDDLILLFDELGIRRPDDLLPEIAPDARRRRITALVNASVVAREEPVVYVIEDAHWVDTASESLLAEFLAVIPQAPALVLISYRPEYDGALSRSAGGQTIALAPLDDSPMIGLLAELLGSDRSVVELARRVADRASGNPFFAQEIIRDLADRAILRGERGAYKCHDDAADVEVPATVQAAIAARIDRLAPAAKRALNAAAVIGLRFDEDLLAALSGAAAVGPLLKAEFIDQVAFASRAEYAFRHPLIRSVAYRSQLASARAELHRRLAELLEARSGPSADDNAALIAEHLEAAGDLASAFGWHMRVADSLKFRDNKAAHQSWRRARDVADRLPADRPGRDAMRVGVRALLCANAFRTGSRYDKDLFDEACALAGAVGDQVSLAIASTGRVSALTFNGQYDEAARFAADTLALIESIGDPMLELTLLPGIMLPFSGVGDLTEFERLAQRAIDLADGDRLKGSSVIESPLTLSLVFRAAARLTRGARGWKDDLDESTAMLEKFAPVGEAVAMWWRWGYPLAIGAIVADATTVCETAELLERAHRSGDDVAVSSAQMLHGLHLVQQPEPHRARGLTLLAAVQDAVLEQRTIAVFQPFIAVEFAKEQARRGDLDGAVEKLQDTLARELERRALGPHVVIVEALVDVLLQRGGQSDVAMAQRAVDELENLPANPELVVYEVALRRLRALLALASGDDAKYRQHRDEYRAMAQQVGFEGHIDTAAAMT